MTQCAHVHDDDGAHGYRCESRATANGYCDYHQFLVAPRIVQPVEAELPDTITAHHSDCGTRFRGCSPLCPKHISEVFWRRGFEDGVNAAVHAIDKFRSGGSEDGVLNSAMFAIAELKPEDHR